jgi:hypothetical protein
MSRSGNKWSLEIVSTIMLGFTCIASSAYAEEATHHELPHHQLGLFVGGGFERDSHSHEEGGTAIGLDYEIKFSEKWGVGAAVEYLSGSDTNRAWVAAVPVSYYLNEKWRLFAGPGIEFAGDHDKYLVRAGVAYEIPFAERWTASPEFIMDFIEGGATTYVLGVSVGYGF